MSVQILMNRIDRGAGGAGGEERNW